MGLSLIIVVARKNNGKIVICANNCFSRSCHIVSICFTDIAVCATILFLSMFLFRQIFVVFIKVLMCFVALLFAISF